MKTINEKLIDKFNTYESDVMYNGNNYLEVFDYSINFEFDELKNWTKDELKHAENVILGRDDIKFPNYYSYWIPFKNKIVDILEEDKNTRRALIHFGSLDNIPSCLISVQFFQRHKHVNVFAHYRSWHLQKYARYDLCLLYKLSQEISKELPHRELGKLFIHASNAHIDYKPYTGIDK